MNLEPISNDKAYRAAPTEVDSLMTAQPGTTEGDRLEVLVTLIEACERRDFPTVWPHAGDASDAR